MGGTGAVCPSGGSSTLKGPEVGTSCMYVRKSNMAGVQVVWERVR